MHITSPSESRLKQNSHKVSSRHIMDLNLRIFFKSCFDHDISTGLSSAVDSWYFNQTTFWRNNNITFISIIVTRVYIEILAWSTNWHQCSSLRWRHNGRDGVSNHQPHGCLLQPFIQTQIKENIKDPRHWPLCGEFTGDRWIPRTNGQ